MAFLVLAGVTVLVDDSSATEREKRRIGETEFAFDGTLRTSLQVSTGKRQFQFTTAPMTVAEVAALRTAIETASGIVTCTGDALDGASLVCQVLIGDIGFIRDRSQAVDFCRKLTLSLTQV